MYAKRDEEYYTVIRSGRLVVEGIAYNEETTDNFEQLIAERKAEYGRMNGNKHRKDIEKAHKGENSSHEEQNSEDQNSDVIDSIVAIHFQ